MDTATLLKQMTRTNMGRSEFRRLAGGLADRKELGFLLLFHHDIHLWQGNGEEARYFLYFAAVLSHSDEDPDFRVKFLRKKAKYYGRMDAFGKAVHTYDRLISLSQSRHLSLLTAEMLIQKGILFEKRGRYSEATELFLKSCEIYEQGSRNNHNYAVALFNLAVVFFAGKKIQQAQDACGKVLELGEKFNSFSLLANANLELANIYEQKKNSVMAQVHYFRALKYYLAAGDSCKSSDIMHKIGVLLFSAGKNEAASKMLLDALKYKMTVDYKESLAKFYLLRAYIMKFGGDSAASSALFDKALYLFEQIGDEQACNFIKFQLYRLSGEALGISLLDFVREYEAPPLKIPSLVKTSYVLRSGEGHTLGCSGIRLGEEKINRKNLSLLFRDLGNAFIHDKPRLTYYISQLKAVRNFLAQSV